MAVLSETVFIRMRVACGNCGGNGQFCKMCEGTGVVCPHCKGAGWCAVHRKGFASEQVRCDTCHTMNPDGKSFHFDPPRAHEAIQEYIAAWFEGRVIDEVLTKRAADEKIAKARKEENDREGGSRRSRLWKAG